MLRIHCFQLWWTRSDPAVEEELHDRPPYWHFAVLYGTARLPDETIILPLRRLLEKHGPAPKALAATNTTLARQGLTLKTDAWVDARSPVRVAGGQPQPSGFSPFMRRCTHIPRTSETALPRFGRGIPPRDSALTKYSNRGRVAKN
jgi:IS5 family transposase